MIKKLKTATRLPYIRFYAGDWLNDNASLSDEELGVYIRMMCRYWMRDGIPWSPEDIAEDMGGANEKRIEIVSRILDKRFSKGRGKRWVHRDLDAARTELRDYKVSQSDSAKAGNNIKHGGKSDEPIKGFSGAESVNERPIKAISIANKDACITPTVTTQNTSEHIRTHQNTTHQNT